MYIVSTLYSNLFYSFSVFKTETRSFSNVYVVYNNYLVFFLYINAYIFDFTKNRDIVRSVKRKPLYFIHRKH